MCQGEQLKVVYMPVQKRIEDYCGLFAIANALTLAQGKNPCNLAMKESEMHEHLLECFSDQVLTDFSLNDTKVAYVTQRTEIIPLFCV